MRETDSVLSSAEILELLEKKEIDFMSLECSPLTSSTSAAPILFFLFFSLSEERGAEKEGKGEQRERKGEQRGRERRTERKRAENREEERGEQRGRERRTERKRKRDEKFSLFRPFFEIFSPLSLSR